MVTKNRPSKKQLLAQDRLAARAVLLAALGWVWADRSRVPVHTMWRLGNDEVLAGTYRKISMQKTWRVYVLRKNTSPLKIQGLKSPSTARALVEHHALRLRGYDV